MAVPGLKAAMASGQIRKKTAASLAPRLKGSEAHMEPVGAVLCYRASLPFTLENNLLGLCELVGLPLPSPSD